LSPPRDIDRLRLAVANSPGDAGRHEALAAALEAAGRAEEAAQAYLAALRLDRARPGAHLGLARIFDARGDVAVAEGGYREALRLDPANARANARLGQILAMARVEEAEPLLRRALAADPADAATAHHLAYVLRRLNRLEEARRVAGSVLARRPFDLQARLMASLALEPVPASAESIAAARRAFARGLEALEADVARFAEDPAQVLGLKWENFALAYHGEDDRPLQEGWGRFVTALLARAAPSLVAPRERRARAPGERLRVGFLSSFLHDCTVGKYFRSWITGLDPGRFEVFAYHTGHARDALTDGIARSGARFRHLFEPAPSVAAKVLADGLDVLVFPDVGMETTANLVAAMRLAPVQCAGWGHPVTTGLPSIDHFLTCAAMEPEGAEAHYRESLVRLPGIGVRYGRPAVPDGATRERFGLPIGAHLYLCPQSAFKIHPDNDALFASVLAADPQGRLVLFDDFDRPLTAVFRSRLGSALAARGVDPARAIFLERVGHADYLRVNAVCDAMLDTLHWSGGNTSLDAIASGLPIVTLPGRFMRGRQSLAMLGILGLEELVATDEADYVRLAVRLATDRPWRAQVAGRMAGSSGRLFDQPGPIEALAAFLEGLGRP
jgi:CRISPR-associated protein Csy1